jgi:hypothetical protein
MLIVIWGEMEEEFLRCAKKKVYCCLFLFILFIYESVFCLFIHCSYKFFKKKM